MAPKSPMLLHRIQLIAYKTLAEIKGEVARNYLGFVWWIIEPVMYMSAFYVVFGLVFKRGGEGFVPFLLIGLIVWKWFDVGVKQSMTTIAKNKGLLAQAYVPKYLFPLIAVAAATFKFLVVFLLLLLFLLAYGATPSLEWFALAGLILLQALFIASVALLVGAWVPLLQDIRPLIDNGLMMMFFLSGVFFDVSSLEGPLRLLYVLNPEAILIDGFRLILIENTLPSLYPLGLVILFSLITGGAGLYSLFRFDRIYPKVM